jgi:hypothetical protein
MEKLIKVGTEFVHKIGNHPVFEVTSIKGDRLTVSWKNKQGSIDNVYYFIWDVNIFIEDGLWIAI